MRKKNMSVDREQEVSLQGREASSSRHEAVGVIPADVTQGLLDFWFPSSCC